MLTTELIRSPVAGAPDTDALAHEDLVELEALARLAWRRGRHDDARAIVHGLLVLRRDNPNFWTLLGEIERDAGNLDAAWEAMNQGLELETTHARAVALADVHLLRGDLDRASHLLTFIRLSWPADDDHSMVELTRRLARQRDGGSR